MPTRLPDPPGALPPLRQGELLDFPAGATFGRLYFAGGEHPGTWNAFRSFGPVATMRFDHHVRPVRPHDDRSISYVAPSAMRRGRSNDPLETCLAEVFASTGVVELSRAEPWFTLWSAERTLRVLDVVDCRWITRAGGNAAISSGSHRQSQLWAKAIHAAYPDVEGIYYECATVPMRRSVTLFERADDALPTAPRLNVPLNHPGLRAAVKRITHALDMKLAV